MGNDKIDAYRFQKVNGTGFKAKFFSFHGRVGRLAFLGRLLIIILVLAGVVFLNLVTITYVTVLGPGAIIVTVVMTLFTVFWVLASSLAALSLYVRRLHDMSLSGYWAVMPVALWFLKYLALFYGWAYAFSGLNFLILLVLLLFPGTKGVNKYGMHGRQSIADTFA